MDGFKFLQFKVYRDAKRFKKEVAEGSSRRSDRDFRRFLLISLGSLNEVVACLDDLNDARMISKKEFEIFIDKAQNIARQLSGFIKTLS
jgi:four helix bundle protein